MCYIFTPSPKQDLTVTTMNKQVETIGSAKIILRKFKLSQRY